MQRRRFLVGAGAGLVSGLWTVNAAAQHAHAEHTANPAAPGKYHAVAAAFAACGTAATRCTAHCQRMLAQGDKSLSECLASALDCEAACDVVARLANLESRFAPAMASAALPVMEACAAACKPHIEHHAECQICYDACLAAISAQRAA